MDAYEHILIETYGGVGLVRLNRPKALNALNHQLLTELMHALEAFESDPNTGAMVITGDERAFAAGADIKEMSSATAVDMLKEDPISPFDRIMRIKKPVIAAVSGWCLGGGNELAMSCDMIIASETARFGQPEITIGVIPGAGGTQRLTRATGKAIAMEMVLNNRTLSAVEAERFGAACARYGACCTHAVAPSTHLPHTPSTPCCPAPHGSVLFRALASPPSMFWRAGSRSSSLG